MITWISMHHIVESAHRVVSKGHRTMADEIAILEKVAAECDRLWLSDCAAERRRAIAHLRAV